MGLFNKLFTDKSKQSNPDNTRLLELINIYWRKNGKGDTYKNVVLELMNGNSFLMFPTKNDFKTQSSGWTISQEKAIIKLSSVVNLDGLKVLGAFTDEQAMFNWTKKPTEYTSMRSQAVLQICEENNIARIVINTDHSNMFVIEHTMENVKEYQIKQDVDVQVGTPNKPLSRSITIKLLSNFKNNNNILEVYQYGQTKEGEFSLVLGFKLSAYSDNAKRAVINTVQNALQDETPDQFLDLFFIETEESYDMIKGIQNSLLYNR